MPGPAGEKIVERAARMPRERGKIQNRVRSGAFRRLPGASPAGYPQFAGNLAQEARRLGGLQAFAAVHAAVNGAGQGQGVVSASHSDVAQTALLFEFLRVVERAAMRKNPLFEAGEEHMIELKSLGGMQSQQGDDGALVELIGSLTNAARSRKSSMRFAALGGFGYGIDEFIQVFECAKCLRRCRAVAASRGNRSDSGRRP